MRLKDMKVLLSLLISFCIPIVTNAQPPSDEITWSDKKLSWNDFKGSPENIRAVAMTNSGIYFSFAQESNGTLEFTVMSTFSKSHSWVKPSGRNDEVLSHEQLHFDITELHARMLRKFLSEYSFPAKKNLSNLVHRYYKERVRELNKMEIKYDSETKHGTRDDVQKKWEDSVYKELKKLDAFTEDVIVRKVK